MKALNKPEFVYELDEIDLISDTHLTQILNIIGILSESARNSTDIAAYKIANISLHIFFPHSVLKILL